ncbi:hypothetical protein L5F43_04635 [Aliarcobacter butzleri]|uniref:hypothetical protein n=1 Tax=Aliarcobacter butzleri TaxID=28197 RepID=UPI001EDC53C6|nr:hypothetical protein [Aliarcobacter butzleri]MCG3705772.1 hypothetical protein [Aliarcobacter butzleri]
MYKSNKRDRGGKRILFVDPSSYDKRRIKIIEYYIETFIADHVQLDFREITVKFQIMFPLVSHLCFHFFKQVSRV